MNLKGMETEIKKQFKNEIIESTNPIVEEQVKTFETLLRKKQTEYACKAVNGLSIDIKQDDINFRTIISLNFKL